MNLRAVWTLGVFAALAVAVWANLCDGKLGIAGLLWGGGREQTWGVTALLLVALLACAGQAVKNRSDGVFIDERNRISLSRFQLITWTLVLVSALFTAGFSNTFPPVNPKGALAIVVPAKIWALLGLGAFSARAAPALLKGLPGLQRHRTVGEASWLDLILSDTDEGVVDVTKVQHLLFTALLVAVYAGDLTRTLSGALAVIAFPGVDDGFLALLGISHAAYLAGKVQVGRRSLT